MTTLAPIALFAYNRPEHTLNLLKSLQRCRLSEQSELIVYSDGPKKNASEEEIKKIHEVRQLVKKEKWCKEVNLIENEYNMGLADSIVRGITETIRQYGKIIVLEDDLLLSTGFLQYLNEALNVFEDEDRVMHISAYMYPVKKQLPELFFVNTASCWGWATWQRAWDHYNPSEQDLMQKLNASGRMNEFTFNGATSFYQQLEANVNGTLKTWAIKWHTSIFLQKGFCLHPFPSLVRNTGNDGSGTHGSEPVFNRQKTTDFIAVNKIPLVENAEARKSIELFYHHLGRKKNIFEKNPEKIFLVTDRPHEKAKSSTY